MVQSKIREAEVEETPSAFKSFLYDVFIHPPLYITITYFNFVVIYLVILLSVIGYNLNYWFLMLYAIILYSITSWRNRVAERERLLVAHRIPFFADAISNSLTVGSTLDQAFVHASFYLKGKIHTQFDHLIVKLRLGQNLSILLNGLEHNFPNTGLRYLISLLLEYKDLGIGISPMLKRVSVALTKKAEAEEKVLTILSAGSNYARISIGIFVFIFGCLSFLLREQVALLFTPLLKPYFLFLLVWTFIGIMVVIRITSLNFARTFALKPYIGEYLKKRELSIDELMKYSGVEWTPNMRQALFYSPMFIGFIGSYLVSLYYPTTLMIILGFLFWAGTSWMLIKYLLKGMFEDQLMRVVEVFPDLLQVFLIGLNSGLNVYQAIQFANEAVEPICPKILQEELTRIEFAIQCGEDYMKTWQLLAKRLPFESVVDFSEIMVMAPVHGQSVVPSVTQMVNSYQEKKLLLMEKKATALGQMVIPIIVVSFFPLFLFTIFAPLISRIAESF